MRRLPGNGKKMAARVDARPPGYRRLLLPALGGPASPRDTPGWYPANVGSGLRGEEAKRATRLPTGHPEAFIEAFGNVYLNATDTMRAKIQGGEPTELGLDFPTVCDGARGVYFIERTVQSAGSDAKWLSFDWNPA